MTPYQQHIKRWSGCTACHLCEKRKRVVLGRGIVSADIALVGESPGFSEDILGKPFVGPAGKLIDYIIAQSIPKEIDYCLTNLVCCIPLDDDGGKATEPDDEAITACSVRLKEFMEIANPRLIVAVGRLATDYLTPGYKYSITFHKPIPLVSIVHPAAILRSNLSQQGLATQKCIITIRDAVEEYLTVRD